MKKDKKDFFSKAEIIALISAIVFIVFIAIPKAFDVLHKKSIELKLEKTYLALSQIADTSEISGVNFQYARYGDDSDEWEKVRNKGVRIIFKKNLKQELQDVEVCKTKNECFDYTIKCLNGSICNPKNAGVYFKFNKNTVQLYSESKTKLNEDYFINAPNDYELTYLIDINGSKGPNTVGKDVFLFIWNERGLTPSGQMLSAEREKLIDKCFVTKATPDNKGYPCLRYIMNNGWHIPNKIWKYKR